MYYRIDVNGANMDAVAIFIAEIATCAMFPRSDCSNNEQLPISNTESVV
jgi:hypothetical protein